jgi:hypothetical protein
MMQAPSRRRVSATRRLSKKTTRLWRLTAVTQSWSGRCRSGASRRTPRLEDQTNLRVVYEVSDGNPPSVDGVALRDRQVLVGDAEQEPVFEVDDEDLSTVVVGTQRLQGGDLELDPARTARRDNTSDRQPMRIEVPPSTGSTTPVTKRASSEARNSAAFAASQAVPIPPSSGT